jgi:hypothetical protein
VPKRGSGIGHAPDIIAGQTDVLLSEVLTEELKFGCVIRSRGNIAVTAADSQVRTAAARSDRGDAPAFCVVPW